MKPEIERLALTLSDIIEAIEVNDAEPGPSRASPDEPELLTMSELVDRQDRAVDYQQNPVGRALRTGAREFGKRIAKSLTYAEFTAVTVAAAKMGDYDRRMFRLDKLWDGIHTKDGALWVA